MEQRSPFPRGFNGKEAHQLHLYHAGTAESQGHCTAPGPQAWAFMPIKRSQHNQIGAERTPSLVHNLASENHHRSGGGGTGLCLLLILLLQRCKMFWPISARTIRHVLPEPQLTTSSPLSWMEVEEGKLHPFWTRAPWKHTLFPEGTAASQTECREAKVLHFYTIIQKAGFLSDTERTGQPRPQGPVPQLV